jgi:hypothetical protein
MQYLELTQRELEYVALSRDTTESDLKQRREIIGGTAHYIDQSAVKAASQGRILVLEGIEKVQKWPCTFQNFRDLSALIFFRPNATCFPCSTTWWKIAKCTWKMEDFSYRRPGNWQQEE